MQRRRKNANSSSNVSNSLLRGRAALEEAENHIKIFDEYLRKNASQSEATINFRNISSETKAENHRSNALDATDFLSNYDDAIDDFLMPDIQPYNPESNQCLSKKDGYSMEIDLINEMMKNGEMKKKRDERMVLNDSNFADELISLKIQRHRDVMQDHQRKSKRKGRFDPKDLSVAKRAVVKASIIAENHAQTEAELKKQSEFKARPLPNGSHVNNDPYALTKAAKGKLSQTIPSEKHDKKNRLDASSILKNHIFNDSVIGSPKKGSDMTRRKNLSNDAVYDEITNIIEEKQETERGSLEDSDDSDLSEQDEKDLACLHQQISKLQAELNLKRMQCIQAIEEIETQGPYKEDSINHPITIDLIPRKMVAVEHNKASSFKSKKTKKITSEIKHVKNNTSLYDRHYKWLKLKEERRKNAKEREDLELVKDVTGKPNLHGAQESWIKAKQQHDGLMKSLQQHEEELKADKQEKDRMLRAKQQEEIEKLKALTSQKNKTAKCGIDGKKQLEYVDKLSRPMSSRKKKKSTTTAPPDVIEIEKEERIGSGDGEDAKQFPKDGEKKLEVSFADMDDKEFSKMIKKLKAKASKGKRTIFPTDDAHNVTNEESNEYITTEIDEKNETFTANDVDDTQSHGRFISGNAQANLYAEINNISLKEDMTIKYNDSRKNNEEDKDEVTMERRTSIRYPYQRFECGEIPFFDRSSSADKGRFRVRDAREYHTDSLRRVPVSFNGMSACDGIMFLIGNRVDGACDEEDSDIVTVLFDRSQFSEEEAAKWWRENRTQIIPSL